MGQFKRKFHVKGDIGHQPPLVSKKTRMVTLSCGIKISTVCSIVSSQSTRVTDRRTDGQNYDSQDRASIAASRGKNDMHIGRYVGDFSRYMDQSSKIEKLFK